MRRIDFVFSDLVVILSHNLHHTIYCVVILRNGEAANSSLAEFYLWFIIKSSIIICMLQLAVDLVYASLIL